MSKLNLQTLKEECGVEISSASYIGRPINNTVMFITKKVEHLLCNLQYTEGCLIFAESTVDVPDDLKKKNLFEFTDTPQKEYARFVEEIAMQREKRNFGRKYTFEKGGYYIGEGVSIGEGSLIEPLCFIGHDVVIGRNARIKSGAQIKNAVIGDDFIAGENCIVGTDGFTMADDEDKNKIRIPTLGKVIIGNQVEIGGLTNISSGSGGNTVIEDHVKIDALVHIGHDVHLSKNVEIPAGAIIGGFVDMGEGAYVGINAVLRNRITLGRNAFVGMGAVVTKNVQEETIVVGNPAKPFIKNGEGGSYKPSLTALVVKEVA